MGRKKPLRVGIAQVPVEMGEKKRNVATLFRYLEGAARSRIDLVVFPECSLAGWLSPAARKAAEAIPGPLTRRLSAWARKHGMGIVLGLEERNSGDIHNSAILIGPDGALLARHRKIDELDIGLELYRRGGSLEVIEFAGRRVALDICADSWQPALTDALVSMGAELVLSPCAWAVDRGAEATNLAWIKETYRLRTKGRNLTIVSANGVGEVTQGPWKGRILQGNSLVTGPDGRPLLEGPTNTPALLTLSL
jgi:predicted amidohydrolase